MTFYSQDKQDVFLETNIFKGFKNGFFIDVGAHDGKSINNTLYFETVHNWTGINIEPLPDIYKQLIINRPNCINLNVAIANKTGVSEFISNKGYTEMLSGLKETFHPNHLQRMNYELGHYGGSSEIIQVNTQKLKDICDEYGISHVHYLSIDVEGAEFQVIQSIDFEKGVYRCYRF